MPRWQKLSIALAGALLMVAAMASEMGAPRAQDGKTAEEIFQDRISGPIVQSRCVTCHVQGGVSSHTRLVLARASDANHETLNLQTFKALLNAVADEGGANYILNKIQGVSHGGGVQVPAGSADFVSMEWFLRQLGGDTGSVTAALTPKTLFDNVRMAPDWKTLRRAALIFAGRIPTDKEYEAVESGKESELRNAVRGLMEGPEFHEFLLRGSNDRLLTARDAGDLLNNPSLIEFTNEDYRRSVAVHEGRIEQWEHWQWEGLVEHGVRQAPLQLIAHVAANDRPYTEILTANYVMANAWSASAYGATTRFDDPTDPHEFRPSRIVEFYRQGEEFIIEYHPVTGYLRVADPGPLFTVFPHAGILNTISFLNRYPTTATNRNRARARWTYCHFLGVDVEKSASRTTDPVALADTNNPTMHNSACTVCHSGMDPVAGAFQNYSDEGHYKWHGENSLDHLYVNDPGEGEDFEITALSFAERQTVTITVWLGAGTTTIRTTPFLDPPRVEGSDTFWNPAIHQIAVRDPEGETVARVEPAYLVEDLDLCGLPRHRQGGEFFLSYFCPNTYFVEVPSSGNYDVEVSVWVALDNASDASKMLSVGVNGYAEGDTWYRDMRTPGFDGDAAPHPDNSVQWLARQIVADDRFAEATVRFWWPAIMGSEVAEFPEESSDTDFEGRLLAATAQDAEVVRLANGFRRGFHGGAAYNLKDLLTETALSKWFRADGLTDSDPVRRTALRDAGARRLLTPEELARKTAAVTGVQWGRRSDGPIFPYTGPWRSALTDEYRMLYGGIDSEGVTERARDLTSVMAGVARRHAVQVACPAVLREFYLVPDTERRLFGGIKSTESGSDAVKAKLIELHEKLYGVRVTEDSADVEAAYQLFVDVSERGKRAGRDRYEWWRCDHGHDHMLLDGTLDNPLVRGEGNRGWWRHEFDWDRLHDFFDDLDLSDPHHTAQAWVVVLTAMMMDYRYLYL